MDTAPCLLLGTCVSPLTLGRVHIIVSTRLHREEHVLVLRENTSSKHLESSSPPMMNSLSDIKVDVWNLLGDGENPVSVTFSNVLLEPKDQSIMSNFVFVLAILSNTKLESSLLDASVPPQTNICLSSKVHVCPSLGKGSCPPIFGVVHDARDILCFNQSENDFANSFTSNNPPTFFETELVISKTQSTSGENVMNSAK